MRDIYLQTLKSAVRFWPLILNRIYKKRKNALTIIWMAIYLMISVHLYDNKMCVQ